MGSGSSKEAKSSSLPAARSGGRRSRGARVLSYTCFGLPSTLPDDDQNEEENGSTSGKAGTGGLEYTSTRNHNERYRKCSDHRQDKIPSLTSSDVEDGKYDRDGTLQTESGASSSSNATAVVRQSSNRSGRSHSRFGFIPDRIGCRFGRTVSSGSSRGHCFFSDCLAISNNDGGDLECIESSVDNQIETRENVNVQSSSSHDVVTSNARLQSTIDNYPHRNHTESENAEVRVSNRRFGPQEPLEGSVRFSRTLSVGRLRDRVLRRTSSSAGTFGSAILEDGSLRYVGQANERQPVGVRRRVLSSDRNNEVWPDSSGTNPYRIANLADTSYDHELGTPHSRDASNHDVHRSAFLERRRRIRSQVRALQRLGSRFENLSGHDRSCILSGQHRSGRCTCRANNRAVNPNDDTGTRASISRIVMLAEALFEVLDEIHQQSVALSSRPSFSSIGSVPAPKEVVECMPMKVYVKPKKHLNEDLAQCYICLVEYEDGDFVRILPCNHEFHQTCIDKWLKEIHRVCPLCRGDVCRADASGSEKIS